SRKTRRGSLSSAPARTITVLRSPGSSPPSEISASFPDKVHRLPSVARPADVAPPPNAGDTASRWLALCWPPRQTVEPRRTEALSQARPTASSKRLLNGALLGSSGTFSALTPHSGQRTR